MNIVHTMATSDKLAVSKSNCIDLPCSQQSNGFDCGLSCIDNLKFSLHFYLIPNVQAPFISGIPAISLNMITVILCFLP